MPALPTLPEAYALLREYGLTPNIVQHAACVARVAVYLTQRLQVAGEDVDMELVRVGALLHDLDKLLTLDSDNGHGHVGAHILRERGYPELALVVERHVLGELELGEEKSWSWEQRLVHYADKLCIGARVVTLADRSADLRRRYPQHAGLFDRCLPLEAALEREILDRAGLRVDELAARFAQE